MGDITPGLVVLGTIRKQTEQAKPLRCKPVSSAHSSKASASDPATRFLP